MKNRIISIINNNLERTFIEDAINDKKYTYEDIHILSLKFVDIFKNENISVGDRVSIVTHNSVEAIIVYFASLYYGVTIIPINPKLSKKEITYIIEDSGSKYIISTSDFSTKLDLENLKVLNFKLSDLNNRDYSHKEPFFDIEKNKDSLIIYSSGTTGRPKAIVHSFFSLAKNAEVFNKNMNINKDSVFLNFLHLTYLGGYYNLLMLPFMAEGKVVLYKQFDLSLIAKIPKLISKYEINILWLVPAIASILVKFDRLNEEAKLIYKNFIELCIIGTAPLTTKLKVDFEEKYSLKLHQNYGLSETLFISAESAPNDNIASVGEILENIKVKISDDGEILVKTPFIMNGYLDEKITSESFVEEWFRTGDIGAIKDNKIIFKERKKDLIIRGGENISPKEIEDVVIKLNFVEDVAIVGVEHEIYGEDIIAFIVVNLDSDKNELLHEVRKICEGELSSNKIPSNFIFLDSFPRTDSGKIDKKELRKYYE